MSGVSSLKLAMRTTHFDKVTFESGYFEIWNKEKTQKIGLIRMNLNFPSVTNPSSYAFLLRFDLAMQTIHTHMRELGLFLLVRSILDSCISEDFQPYAHAMAVISCAHSAEILIKARIAQEHPLLIFSEIPAPDKKNDRNLSVEDLFTAKTIGYQDLPDILWASAGYKIIEIEKYKLYGKLRNQIMHFGVPPKYIFEDTLTFAFNVLEPMLYEFWKINIFDYFVDFDPEMDIDVEKRLKQFKIPYNSR